MFKEEQRGRRGCRAGAPWRRGGGEREGKGGVRLGLEIGERAAGVSLGLNSRSDVRLLRGLG